MKKSLIALAVLGFAGAAMAQSSVTMYGVADVGVGQMKSPALNGGSDKTQMVSSDTVNNGNARLGVRGVEDLGGGLKASFNFETGLNLNNGGSNGGGGDGGFWGRQAWLALGGNWGTFKMGRAFTPSMNAQAVYELTGQANYSAVNNTYGFGGAYNSRNSSQFSYSTPNFGGLNAEIGFVSKNNNGIGNRWDVGVSYAQGPIGVGLSANKTKHDKTNWALGGKYDFGQFVVAASYNSAHALGLQRRGVALEAGANFGAFGLTGQVTRDTKNHLNARNKKYTNALLEAKYALSKRTFVYADYLRFDNKNNWGLGVRHNF